MLRYHWEFSPNPSNEIEIFDRNRGSVRVGTGGSCQNNPVAITYDPSFAQIIVDKLNNKEASCHAKK